MNNLHSIFDVSNCISQKQMQDYLHGKLLKEEAMLVESHISSCALCSDAIDGYMMQENINSTNVPVSVKIDFLEKVNEINASTTENKRNESLITHEKIARKSFTVFYRKWYVAAGILLLLSTGIFTVYSFIKSQQGKLAKNNKLGNQQVAAHWEKTEEKNKELMKIKVSPDESLMATHDEKSVDIHKNEIKSVEKKTSEEKNTEQQTNPKTIETKAIVETENNQSENKQTAIADIKDNNIENNNIVEDYAAVQNNYKEAAAPAIEKPVQAVSEKPAATAGMRNISGNNQIQNNAPPSNMQYTELGKNKKSAPIEQLESKQKNEINDTYDRAMQYYKNKEYLKCIEQLKAAIHTADVSKKEDIYYYLALCYESIQDEQNALTYWNKLTNSNKYSDKAQIKTKRAKKK